MNPFDGAVAKRHLLDGIELNRDTLTGTGYAMLDELFRLRATYVF